MIRNYNLTEQFDFNYSICEIDEINTKDYFDAIDKTTQIIFDEAKKSNLNKIGLCLSGLDSELIGYYLHKNSIPTEYFFLHITNVNDNDLIICEQISKKHNTILNVLSLNVDEIVEEKIYENFNITYTCWPTYVTVPSLIKKIPSNFYIVLGEGDLEKTNNDRYQRLYESKIKDYTPTQIYIPMHLTEVAYKRTLAFYEKKGESNFYSKNFNLWYHLLRHKNLITNYKYIYDPKKLIYEDFLKINSLVSPLKTLNYTDANFKISKKIVDDLCRYGKTKYLDWNPYIGDIVVIDKNLIS